MAKSSSVAGLPDLESQKPSQPLLDYGCSYWKFSSQRAADLYDSGVKLWTKRDLREIEQQLTQSYTTEKFTVSRIDGSTLQIRNPIIGVKNSIWKPQVQFQEYWGLVKEEPKSEHETYHCSYLIEWNNQTMRKFREPIAKSNLYFEEKKLCWNKSISYKALVSYFEGLLSTIKVTKVICFGLGDMCREPPDWLRRLSKSSKHELDLSVIYRSMVQHSVALSLADTCRKHGRETVRLLAQDPDYTVEAIEILERNGFEVVGQFGAGGFAEIDNESVVLSPFVNAPVKQIIADIARPALVITNGFEVFNDHEKPWADAESPRTKQMWQEYQSCDFPIATEEIPLMGELHKMKLYVRLQ